MCSDEEFKSIVSNSDSYKEVMTKLGYKSCSGNSLAILKRRIEELEISIEHFNFHSEDKTIRNEENVFIKDSTANQSTLRRWYIKGNYSSYVCSICGLEPKWQNKPLTLILDHINGENHDDRLENLRWVCPNCNS